MRAEEYIQKAVALIDEPNKAAAVRRELQASLEKAVAEILAEGGDSDTAEHLAVTRMKAPESVALDLAAVHHRNLPWRFYLALIPLVCLAAIPFIWHSPQHWWRPAKWWLLILMICVAPTRAAVTQTTRRVVIDVQVKWRWLREQPVRWPFLLGAGAGLASGMVWGLNPLWLGHLPGIWPGPDVLVALPPLVPLILVAFVAPRHRGATIVTAAFAALAFPFGYVPGLLLWWTIPRDWPFMLGYFFVLYTLAALTIGWLVQVFFSRKRSLPEAF